MKKTVIMLLTLLMMNLFTTTAFTELPLRVVVNNVKVDFPDAQPHLDSNGRVQVPVRFVTEALGANVSWNEASQVVTITRNNTTVTMKIGENIITVNGHRRTLDTKAVLISRRTFVPVRFVSEAFGAKVTWDTQIRTAYINIDPNAEVKEPTDEGETKYYSGIAFNPKTDIAKDGRMKLPKAQEFMLKLLDQITFYKKDGKYYVKCTYPELPDGFKYSHKITVVNNDSEFFSLLTGAYLKEQDIPRTGSYQRHIPVLKNLKDLNGITVMVAVDMAKGFGEYGDKNEGYITLSYREPNKVNVNWNIFPDGTEELAYDVKKLFKW